MDRTFRCILLTLIIGSVIFQSCSTRRNLVYFSNLPDSAIFNQKIFNEVNPKIQPGDALAIKVTTLNPDANILLNSGSLPMNNQNTGVSSSASSTATLSEGYLVDKDGFINFPLLGKIELGGLTREGAQKKMTDLISKTNKGTIVNISIQNFKVTVIGEVSRPGTFNVANDRINVLEALGRAGDMTAYSVRSNVLVIREQNGVRSMQRLNLNDKDVFNSPFFYLKQNDVVYVQPENKLKDQQAKSGDFRLWSIIVSGLSVLSLIFYRFR